MVYTRATGQGFRPIDRHRFTPPRPSPESRALRSTACHSRERAFSSETTLPSQGSSPSTASSVRVTLQRGPSILRPWPWSSGFLTDPVTPLCTSEPPCLSAGRAGRVGELLEALRAARRKRPYDSALTLASETRHARRARDRRFVISQTCGDAITSPVDHILFTRDVDTRGSGEPCGLSPRDRPRTPVRRGFAPVDTRAGASHVPHGAAPRAKPHQASAPGDAIPQTRTGRGFARAWDRVDFTGS